jgi:hypothetical protein
LPLYTYATQQGVTLVKIFFSAGENPQHAKKIVGAGAKNILLSYYYIRKKRMNTIWAIENAAEGTEFMLDSGAHTIQKEDISGSHQEDFYSRYCEEYLNWVAKYGKKIGRIVELDIEESTSLSLVRKLQDKYFKPFAKETGKPVIYVWHKERGLKGWSDMCKDSYYTGLGQEDGIENRYRQMIRVATQNKSQVHGFAMTKPDVMLKAGFFSCDSTSWLAAELYGCSYIWKSNRMIMLDKDNKGQKRVYKNYYERLGLDFKKIMAEDPLESGKANVAAWIQCENFINERTKKTQWWNDTSLDNIKTTEVRPIMKPESENAPKTFKLRIKKTEPKTGVKNGLEDMRNELDKKTYPIQDTQGITSGDKIDRSTNEDTPNSPTDSPITGEGMGERTQDEGEQPNTGSDKSMPSCPQTGEKSLTAGHGNAGNGAILDDSDHQKLAEARKRQHIEMALVCDNCVSLENCPNSKAGSVCTLINTFKRMDSTSPADCLGKIREIISVLETRAWRNMYFEQLDGGVADKNNSALMGDLVEYHKLYAELLKDMLPNRDKVTIEGSDILARIFGPAQGAIDVTKTAENVSNAEVIERTGMPQDDNTPTKTLSEPENAGNVPCPSPNEVLDNTTECQIQRKSGSLADKLKKMMEKR